MLKLFDPMFVKCFDCDYKTKQKSYGQVGGLVALSRIASNRIQQFKN